MNEEYVENELVKDFIEVTLPDPENFLKIKETLTRIGIASKDSKTLWQSCHILSKNRRTKYYIVHFKELFMLDEKFADFSQEDKARRNTISNLLDDWGLLELVNPEMSSDPVANLNTIKIIPYKEKGDWNLVPKYNIGGYVQNK